MSKFDSKVIGYLAALDKINLLCSGDACVIAESEDIIRSYILRSTPELIDEYRFRKARYKDIIAGLLAGGAYAFDKVAYQRFQPMAIHDGHDLSSINFEDHLNKSDDLLIVRLTEP